MGTNFIRSVLLASASAAAAAAFVPAAAYAQDASYELDIPAQPLGDALRALGRATKHNVVFDGAVVRGKRSTAVKGRFSADAALERMLDETGLVMAKGASGSLTVRLGNGQGGANLASSTGEGAVGSDIVVTGSRIRGRAAAGSQVVTITRKEIEERGYASLADALKTVPQTAPAIQGSNFFEPAVAGSLGPGNITKGTAVDLRGLGTGTTLVLINGQRQPRAGSAGLFTDISTIPTAAIDHVEILLDGASAIYGSDAIGGVVNIILRKDYNGSETSVRYGSYNGDASEIEASQVVGRSWQGGNAFLGAEYYSRDELHASSRSYAANCDKTTLGGSNWCAFGGLVFSNPANVVSPFTGQVAFYLPPGQSGTGLTPTSYMPGTLPYNLNKYAFLTAPEKKRSIFGTFSQEITDFLRFDGGARYTERQVKYPVTALTTLLRVPASNAFQVYPDGLPPFPILFLAYDMRPDMIAAGANGTTSKTGTWDVNGRLQADIFGAWRGQAAVTYSRSNDKVNYFVRDAEAFAAALADSNPSTAFNPFGEGSNTNPTTLAEIFQPAHQSIWSDAMTVSAEFEGPLIDLPAGSVRAVAGTSFFRDRQEFFDVLATQGGSPNNGVLKRTVHSLYGELSVPILVNSSNRKSPSLLMQIAGRYDHYSDFGDTVNPKVGLVWKVLPGLSLRGTWGTSFRAPDPSTEELPNANRTNYRLGSGFISPTGVGTVNVLTIAGVSPDLGPEKASTWSIGFDFDQPKSGLPRVSVTYTEILYHDRIGTAGTPGNTQNILREANLWGDAVSLSPSSQQIADACNSSLFLGDVSTCLASNPIAIVDFRTRNLAYTRSRSLDLRADRDFDVGVGTLNVALDGTYNFEDSRALSNNSARVDILDKKGNNLSLKGRVIVALTLRDFNIRGTINYAPSYRDPVGGLSGTPRKIDSWTTGDLYVEYRPASGFLRRSSLALSVVNLFNQAPPFVDVQTGYDGGNANPYGRIMSLQLKRQW